MGRAPFTVVIPAHNEEALIGRTLEHLLDGWDSGDRPRIIVSCNGCRDSTAAVARRFAHVEVIEMAAASKTAAINAGLARIDAFPVVVIDADIRIGRRTLEALARTLREDGVMAASPSARHETAHSSAPVRAYYRVWLNSGYLDNGVGGSGVYGLSEEGARALGTLPAVIGDDTYVRWFFPLEQQRRISAQEGEAIVEAPGRLANLLACEVRWQAGNRQLRTLMGARADDRPPRNARPRPPLSDTLIYYGIKLLARVRLIAKRLTGTANTWGRDLSSRGATDRQVNG